MRTCREVVILGTAQEFGLWGQICLRSKYNVVSLIHIPRGGKPSVCITKRFPYYRLRYFIVIT